MTVGACDNEQVERLDRSKRPPGWVVEIIEEWGELIIPDRVFWRARAGLAEFHRCSELRAIAAAWAQHERERDPPGMTVEHIHDEAFMVRGMPALEAWTTPAKARAAAWAWYWDAVEVAALLATPRVVAWADVPDRVMVRNDAGFCYLRRDGRGAVAGVIGGAWHHGLCFGWGWTSGEEAGDERVAIVALGVTGYETTDDLKRLAEVRERGWWPRTLTWTTEDRAAVRRWLTEGGELPEVLRG